MPTAPSPPRLMKAVAAAQYCGVHEATFVRWVEEGKIAPPRVIGGNVLYERGDIDAFIDALPRRGAPANDPPQHIRAV